MKQTLTESTISMQGRVRSIKTDSKTGKVIAVSEWTNNLIMFSTGRGKQIILDRLAGVNTYSLNIGHGEMGSGSTTPAITDTQLTTPVARSPFSDRSVSSNVATLKFFFPDADLANGTYREFGTFIDGTGTLSSGRLFNHVLFASPYVKASGEDTTIQVDIEITI